MLAAPAGIIKFCVMPAVIAKRTDFNTHKRFIDEKIEPPTNILFWSKLLFLKAKSPF